MDKNIHLGEISIRDIISAIFRQKTIIIITYSVIMTSVFIGLLFQTKIFEARVKMHIKGQSQISAETYQGIGPFRVHLTQMQIVKSNPVIIRAVQALKLYQRPIDYEKNFCNPLKKVFIEYKAKILQEELDQLTPEDQKAYFFEKAKNFLIDTIRTDLIPHTDIFTIKVQDFSHEGAIAIANVVSRAYCIYDQQQQLAELTMKYGRLHPTVQQLRDNITRMSENLSGAQLPDLEAIGAASVKIIEQAISNKIPIGKSKPLLLIIALFVSGFVGIALGLLVDFLDTSFKSPQEIIKFLGLPLLGSIPKKKYKDDVLISPGKLNPSKSETIYSQFYEDLSDQLLIYMKVNNLKTILLTSTMPHEGISTICANLGICFAQQLDHKTLLIDANFRNPSMHKIFNLENGPGIANMLEKGKLIEYHSNLGYENINKTGSPIFSNKQLTLSDEKQNNKLKIETDKIVHHYDPNLDILQAGSSSVTPITLLSDSKIDGLLKLTKVEYDAVIIDCTNIRDYKDAGILSSHVDGVVVIVNDGKGRRQVIMNSISYLKQKKANPIGVILNKRRLVIPKIIYDRL